MTPTVRSVTRASTSAGIEVQALGIDVAEDHLAAEQGDHLGGGEEAERGDDHLVPRLEAEGAQAEDQGVGAVGETDAGLDAQIGGEGRIRTPSPRDRG